MHVLLPSHLRHDPDDTLWPDRDRVFCAPGVPVPPGADAHCLDAPPGFTGAAAVGAALAERLIAARFGRSLVDHRIWLLANATELSSGPMLEAAAIAGAVPLGSITVVATVVASDQACLGPFAALGWVVRRVAGADQAALDAAAAAAARAQKPTLIVRDSASVDALPSVADPDRSRAAGARRAWLKRQRRHANAEAFQHAVSGRLPAGGIEAITVPPPPPASSPAEAVRTALRRLVAAWPELAGLSPHGFFALPPTAVAGHAVAWGERPQATAAGVLGMAMHGGVLPVSELSRLAVDAALPAMRVAAAQGLRFLILVRETQPLPEGTFASVRGITNVRLFRPADSAEALECLALALRHVSTPSLLVLDTHESPGIGGAARSCARGGYVMHEPAHRDVTLIAGGADLRLAIAARRALEAQGIAAACVSLPCGQLFVAQDLAYRQAVLGTAPRVALEAGSAFGWASLLGADGVFIDTRSGGDIVRLVLRALGR